MKITALAVGLSLLTASATSFADWSEHGTVKVQGIHTQIKDGVPFFAAYYLTNTKAIVLNNLDKPDIQLVQKELEFSYQTGKSLTFLENRSRDARTATWCDLAGAWTSMTLLEVYSGDEMFFHIK